MDLWLLLQLEERMDSLVVVLEEHKMEELETQLG
jgi:hypothetical protein